MRVRHRTTHVAAALVVAASLGGCGHGSRPDNLTDASYIEVMGDTASTALLPGNNLSTGDEALPSFADFADVGTFSSGEDGFYIGGVNAEQAAAEAFDRGGAQTFSVETLKATDTDRLLLVERQGLAHGLAEDERLLLLFQQTGGAQQNIIPAGLWRVVQAGRQQRCRGSARGGWTSTPCGQ